MNYLSIQGQVKGRRLFLANLKLKFTKMYKYLSRLVKDNRLYFGNMCGAGVITCCKCNSEYEAISYLHGDGDIIGFQCQKCGKFHEIEDVKTISIIRRCECSGNLESTKPIFCPGCRSLKVRYTLKLMT